MALRERIYERTDRPMSWTRAIITGLLIWILTILLLGQVPSYLIYAADTYIAEIINFSKNIPGVNDAGLNSTQVQIVRDLVANGVQMGLLVAMLLAAYIWQERKRKRTGSRGVQDVVKGYMPGK